MNDKIALIKCPTCKKENAVRATENRKVAGTRRLAKRAFCFRCNSWFVELGDVVGKPVKFISLNQT